MSTKAKRPTWIVRVGMAHKRLLISAAIGIATIFVLRATGLPLVTRVLLGWDTAIVIYLVVVAAVMARCTTVASLRTNAAIQDEGAFAILLLTVAAAIASLGAIFAKLAALDRANPNYGLHIALVVTTVVLSWTFTHTIFALHYAHDFYREAERNDGLKFPGNTHPDYWDFVYFSFVIGMTFQVSDVAVTNKSIRRMVVAHGALSFFFSTAIVALTVNIAAGLVPEMTAAIQLILFLLAVLALVAIIAQRLKLAPSILLVIAGIAIAFVPGLPAVELAPDLVLLVLLPPLIYSAGVSMSWREFCFNLRPITLLAFGAVIFTTVAVAAAIHHLLGWPWSVAFVLGAIVSPPDVVAPLAIARRLGLPRRLLVVLEGEGLANDATALILYRFAVVAVSTGMFSAPTAAGTFALIVAGEIAYGVGVGWLSLRLRHWAQNPRVEITLSLMTPFLAFWVPHHFGGSGVLATVAAGLYVSWNGPRLISASTRLQGIFFWDLIMYLIEGFVFLITGLQARTIIEKAQSFPVAEVLAATAVTAAIVIVARFVWVFPASYGPLWLFPSIRRRDPYPHWKWVFIVAFTGVRGVVSLAAALAIPLWTEGGAAFPNRDLILLATFGVIIITLVGQGLMLPGVIRWLDPPEDGDAEHRAERQAELEARSEAIRAARQHLDRLAAERGLSEEVVAFLNARHDHRERLIPGDLDDGTAAMRARNNLRLELIAAEREFLYELLRGGRITDESRRRLERDLDLEEAAILARREAKRRYKHGDGFIQTR